MMTWSFLKDLYRSISIHKKFSDKNKYQLIIIYGLIDKRGFLSDALIVDNL